MAQFLSSSTKPYIIVLGNEKGGTGKSTVAMHLIAYLLQENFKVGSIDLDARQGTLSRYIKNRLLSAEKQTLAVPEHLEVLRSEKTQLSEAQAEEEDRLKQAFAKLSNKDFIVIDTPGNDSYLSRLAHSYPNLLITSLNDSFVDLDVLVRFDSKDKKRLVPGVYADMVWEQKKRRAMRDGGTIDWIVVRNRLTTIGSKNKEAMMFALEQISPRLGFRLAPGFCERVIFRELFSLGLTVLDLGDSEINLTISHIAAKQELLELIKMINLPALQVSNKNENYEEKKFLQNTI